MFPTLEEYNHIRLFNTISKEVDLKRTYPLYKDYHLKPHGLWYSIDTEWIEWCKDNQPSFIKPNSFNLEINLNECIVISTEKELVDFNKEYTIESYYKYIDWNVVRKKFKGIEIRNYKELYEYRYNFDYLWFSGWDVSSGCIWDLSIINKVEPYLDLSLSNSISNNISTTDKVKSILK